MIRRKNIKKERCPKCNTVLKSCPGIGPFCPNKKCDVIDGLIDVIPSEDKEFTLKTRKMVSRIAKIKNIDYSGLCKKMIKVTKIKTKDK